ncbi:AhpC/TSA family protein [Synechococcus sp. M16CYN]|uniref:AhpC/TSA family protein n=1 Tax=Synechococcus sp. M16CYN TaxID=3103139 RepID=UPI0030E4DE60
MKTPKPLLNRIAQIKGMETGRKRLIIVTGQLGDFDSLEYAQVLVRRLDQLQDRGIKVQMLAIGTNIGANRFCDFTGFPRQQLEVSAIPTLHEDLELEAGLKLPGGPWLGFLLMCAGIRSPGTLQEVLRGYTGDRSAPQIFTDDDLVQALPFLTFRGNAFRCVGGDGFQRPFELATWRLRNMSEVLRHWRTYVPCDDYITQRGATYFLDVDDTLLYKYRNQSLLKYSETMATPLAFLDQYFL